MFFYFFFINMFDLPVYGKENLNLACLAGVCDCLVVVLSCIFLRLSSLILSCLDTCSLVFQALSFEVLASLLSHLLPSLVSCLLFFLVLSPPNPVSPLNCGLGVGLGLSLVFCSWFCSCSRFLSCLVLSCFVLSLGMNRGREKSREQLLREEW
jgi:hypothetical protein